MRAAVDELAAMERPSASDGERRAADWIAERLQALGAPARTEQERAHGGYWWPVGIPNAAALAAALALGRRPRSRLRRALALLVGGAGAAAIWDDTGGGRLWFRRVLPQRTTTNVVAEVGDPDAARTLVFVSHHDAAHTGLVFHPALSQIGPGYRHGDEGGPSQTFPIMFAVWIGPVLLALAAATGLRPLQRLAALFGGGSALAMADIGARGVVPGANDNLSAVAVVLGLARRLRDEPVAGLRIVLLSTGSEESFMEGMQGWMRRHGGELDPERTEVVCLESLGSPYLQVIDGEGMLRMRTYSKPLVEAIDAAARAVGIVPGRGLRTVAATDGLIPLRAGIPTATLCSINDRGFPSNYHWDSDRPENVSWETVDQALETCWSLLRMRAVPVAQPE
jgi:hypothetical protein